MQITELSFFIQKQFSAVIRFKIFKRMWKMFAYKLALNFPRCAIAKAAWIPTYDTLYYVRVYGTNGDSTQRRRKDDKTSCFGHGQSQRCTQKCPLIWSRWTLQPYCGRALINFKDFLKLVKKWLINWGKIPIFWFCNKWFNVDCNTFLLWRNVNHCKSNNSFAKFWDRKKLKDAMPHRQDLSNPGEMHYW